MLTRSASRLAISDTQCLVARSRLLSTKLRPSPQQNFVATEVRQAFQQRWQSTGTAPPKGYAPPKKSRWERIQEAVRDHPVQASLGIAMISVCLIGFGYSMYIYVKYVIPNERRYPEAVRKPLKRAVYYTNSNTDPKKALKYYKEALFAAQETGMDPFSDEVIGIKLKIVDFLENVHHFDVAIQLLEQLKADLLEWVEKNGSAHVKDGLRTKHLTRIVSLDLKLGDLYSLDWVERDEDAERSLTSAVERILKEQQRIAKEGIQEGEGDLMTDEQVGESFRALASYYTTKGKHNLATPLYLHSLRFVPPKSCKTVLLMNNVAASLAQQTPPQNPPPNFPSLDQQAGLWAKKAIELSDSIPTGERDVDCDVGCATAKANLGRLSETTGKFNEALKLFSEAESLSIKAGFDEGKAEATEGLKRVQAKLGKNRA